MSYVIVCNPVPDLPADVVGYELTDDLDALKVLFCVDRATHVDVRVIETTAGGEIDKPFCDTGRCIGSICRTA